MRPTLPYHAVTGFHREPGGLRRLDWFMGRITGHVGERDPAGYRILDATCGQGNLAVPLAVMGFAVTGLDRSDAAIKSARLMAQEAGVGIDLMVGTPNDANGRYDAIIYSATGQDQDAFVDLVALRERLSPQGKLLVFMPRGRLKYAASVRQLRQAGFWITGSRDAGVFLRRLFYGPARAWLKRGSRLFHVLDKLDDILCALWPRTWADGWLWELRQAAPEPLAVQLIPTLERGGAERIVMQLTERLPSYGFSVMTLAHIRGGDLEKDFADQGLSCIVLPRRGLGGRWMNFWELRRLLSDLQPAIVHTHLFGSDLWGRLAARAAGLRRIVTTEHNVNPDLGLVRTAALKLLKGLSVRYIAISRSVETYLKDVIRVPADRIRLIYNGVDLKRVIPRAGSAWRDVPRLIFVGRLEPQKDPELVLRALAPIKRPWSLTMVGVGSLDSRLKELAEELKVSARVNFLGRREDVPRLLADHDLFLFPSRWEGFGLAVIEAAAAGVPVLASDLPVLRELLTPDQATFLPSGDTAAWTQAIESALADPAPLAQKAQHAAAADWSRFSQERMAEQYAELYRSLL